MSKSDFSGFEKLMGDMQKLTDGVDQMLEDLLLDIALRVLKRTKERTPTGEYNKKVSFVTKDGKEVSFTPKTGKVGGALKRGWKLGKVTRTGDNLTVEIYNKAETSNKVEYAPYVEIGHRIKVNGKVVGWWEGYHMCEISIHEIEQQIPARLGKAWKQFCATKLGGG